MRISQGLLTLAMFAGNVLAAPAQSIKSEIAHDDVSAKNVDLSPWFLPWRRDEKGVDQHDNAFGVSPWFLPWRRDEKGVDQHDNVFGVSPWFLPWRRDEKGVDQTENVSV